MNPDDFQEAYPPGARVRLVQNRLLTGQIIGERMWGTEYNVRLAATVTALWFDVCELEPDPDFDLPPANAAKEEPTENVIDFDAAVAARKGA